jgi:hypothetical protein
MIEILIQDCKQESEFLAGSENMGGLRRTPGFCPDTWHLTPDT